MHIGVRHDALASPLQQSVSISCWSGLSRLARKCWNEKVDPRYFERRTSFSRVETISHCQCRLKINYGSCRSSAARELSYRERFFAIREIKAGDICLLTTPILSQQYGKI